MHRLRSNAFIAFSAVSVAALIALTPWAARAQMTPAAPAQSSGGASVGAGALTMQSDGSAAQVVYGDIRSPYRLSIVQLCSPNNGKCTLAFVDTRDGDDAAALVRDYYRRTGGKATPNVSTQATCASGWIASAMAEQVAFHGDRRKSAATCPPQPRSRLSWTLAMRKRPADAVRRPASTSCGGIGTASSPTAAKPIRDAPMRRQRTRVAAPATARCPWLNRRRARRRPQCSYARPGCPDRNAAP